MPRIDSNSLQIDSRNAKSNPDGPKLTSNSDKVISNIPVIPKSNSHIMLKIEYIFIPLGYSVFFPVKLFEMPETKVKKVPVTYQKCP